MTRLMIFTKSCPILSQTKSQNQGYSLKKEYVCLCCAFIKLTCINLSFSYDNKLSKAKFQLVNKTVKRLALNYTWLQYDSPSTQMWNFLLKRIPWLWKYICILPSPSPLRWLIDFRLQWLGKKITFLVLKKKKRNEKEKKIPFQ